MALAKQRDIYTIYRAEPSDSSKKSQTGIAGFLGLANYGSLFRLEVAEDVEYKDNQNNTPTMDIAFVTTGWNKKALIINITDISAPTIIKEIDLSDAAGSITNVLYNKEHKLLFIIAGTKLYVYELKSLLDNNLQGEPRRVGVFEDEALFYTGSITADDKYLYIGSDKLLVIQYDPLYGLELDEKDKEFPGLINLPAGHYYPALGDKEIWIKVKDGVYQEEMGRIIRDKRDISTAFKDAAGKSVKIAIINDNVDEAKPAGCTITGTDTAEPKKSPIEMDTEAKKAHAKFILKCENLNETEKTTGKIKALFERGLLRGEGDAGDPDRRKGDVVFTIKTNANVTFAEVRDGKAVYTYDKDTTDTQSRTLSTNNPAIDDNKKFDFVQELFNQVVPRKRNITGNIFPNNTLMEEDGEYDVDAEFMLEIFKNNFNLGIDTKVDFTIAADGKVSYNTGDDTSSIFRKLMKDYGEAGTGLSYRSSVEKSRAWLHKVIGKETLVGSEHHALDVNINTSAGGIISGDTGLYELYANVVKKFVGKMIEEGEMYAGMSGTPVPTTNWVARTGEGSAAHGAGMSYSFGGKQTIQEFIDTVSRYKAPPNTQYPATPATSTAPANPTGMPQGYRGNIDDNSGNIAVGGTKKWPGLIDTEWNIWRDAGWIREHHFDPFHWAGVDCSGFVYWSMRSGKDQLGDLVAMADVGNYKFTNNTASGYFNEDRAMENNRVFGFNTREAGKLRKGDLIRYRGRQVNHVSTVYSDKSSCDNKDNCTYEIIHAYGVSHADLNNDGVPDEFTRKVVKSPNQMLLPSGSMSLSNPTGFGRIKLWD